MVNAYFDLLISYGDQSKVIGFEDLIEVQSLRDGTLMCGWAIYTTSPALIKKVVRWLPDTEAVLVSSAAAPAELTLYSTPAIAA